MRTSARTSVVEAIMASSSSFAASTDDWCRVCAGASGRDEESYATVVGRQKNSRIRVGTS